MTNSNEVSKIKHLSLRSKSNQNDNSREEKIKGGLLEDPGMDGKNLGFGENNNQLASSQFFQQTINFKNTNPLPTEPDQNISSVQYSLRKNKNVNLNADETFKDASFRVDSNIGQNKNRSKENRRVFQKTITLLFLDLAIFAGFVFCSINLFFLNSNIIISFFIGILVMISYVIVTNIFYIILSEKKYLWILLFSKAILFLVLSSFISQLFSLITIVGVIIVFLMTYISYVELEKIQLGSRLFAISSIVSESTRVLVTMCIFIISLCTLNQIIYQGSDQNGKFIDGGKFVERVFLNNDYFAKKVLMGIDSPVKGKGGLNNIFINKNLNFSGGNLNLNNRESFTVRDFLILNYKTSELVNETELSTINEKCQKNKELCDLETRKVADEKLAVLRNESFPNLGPEIINSSVIDESLYRKLTTQFYLNLIKANSGDLKDANVASVPLINLFSQKYIIPGVFSLFIFIFLTLIRPIIFLIINIGTFLFWHFMRLVRFARIEIETVESEVVSI